LALRPPGTTARHDAPSPPSAVTTETVDHAGGLALRELRFLQRLAVVAASTHVFDQLVELVIRETTSALGTDVCSLYLLEADARQLRLTATNGLRRDMAGKVVIPVGQGVTGWVAERREPALVADVAIEPRWKWVPGLDRDEFRSMLSVPVEAGPRLVGVLNVQTSERREFSVADIDFLRAIASQVAGTLERSEMHRRLADQLRQVELSRDIHERFTRLALQGGGPRAILEEVAQLAGGKAWLFAPDGQLLLTAPSTGGPNPRLRLPPGLVPSAGPRRIQLGRPPITGDVLAVRDSARLFGIIVIETTGEDRPDGRLQAIEHGATILALEMSKERTAAEVERRLRGDLVEQLLVSNLDATEATRLARQAERLGHRLPAHAWVLALEPDRDIDEESADTDSVDALLSQLVKKQAPDALVVARTASAVVILPESSAPNLARAEELAHDIQVALARSFRPATISAGIGSLANSVEELSRSYSEARQALRLLRRAGGRERVTSYRSLGAFRLLLEVQRPEAVRLFVQDLLGNLIDYGDTRATPLLETLEGLVEARWVRTAAARRLNVHVNSLAYRLQRIEALTGLDLDDPEVRVAVTIALQARRMLAEPGANRLTTHGVTA